MACKGSFGPQNRCKSFQNNIQVRTNVRREETVGPKQSITHLFKTFSGLDLVVMRLFWQKGRKIQSTERFKTSASLNARFRESYFKLKVNGRAVTSQLNRQATKRGSRVCVSVHRGKRIGKMSSSNNIKRISKQHIGMKLLFSSWAFVYFLLVISSFSSLVKCVAFRSFVVVFN